METFDKIYDFVRRFIKKTRWVFTTLFFLLLIFMIFKKPILQGFGGFLMCQTPIEKADAIFILGGNVNDRSILAAKLYNEGWSNKIIPLGANFDFVQEVITGCNPDCIHSDCDPCKPDALLMQEILEENLNIPFEAIIPLPQGTSTKEESDVILEFSIANNYKNIIIVSDLFHLRRISYVFIDKFQEKNIHVILQGAKSSHYSEEYWWQYEQGLIMLNNEYIKLMYYWIKGY